jgi:hypothetical protein
LKTIKPLIVLILNLISLCSYCLDKTKYNFPDDFKRVQIGFNISPDLCFRTLKDNENSATSNIIMKYNKERETFKVSYTAGLNVSYNIKKSIGIETGIQYSNKGFQTKLDKAVPLVPDPTNPDKFKYIFNYHYLDFPLKVNFTFGENKVRFFSSAGITTNLFLKQIQTNVYRYSDRTIRTSNPTIYDYKKVNLSPTISIGIDYKINEKMNLRIEPTFRYGVIAISDDPITYYLYNGGLNMSFYYGL